MRLTRFILAGLALLPATPLAAQLRSSRPPRPQVNNPRLLVANPYTFSQADSAAAVRVGSGLRERVERNADKWYTVIQRAQMNEALRQYLYPEDAVLPPLVARQLAASLQARAMVISTMSREGGRLTVESRLTRASDDAGHMVRVSQVPGQSFEEFGQRVADSLANAFKALPDAQQCETLRGANPTRAAEAATKALRVQPDHGLASYCLAQIAIARKAPVDEIIGHLRKATRGDRLSLESWTALAVQYQAKGDTVNTVQTFKEMLRVAPTNQKLREEVFRYLVGAGQPDAAEEVSNEGIAIDSLNADMWDLRAGACLFQEDKPDKVRCALESIDQVYALDTAKAADTLFIIKAIYAATRESAPDTARLVKWTDIGLKKAPHNGAILAGVVTRYSWTGPLDSLVSATRNLVSVDSTDLTPVVRAVKSLGEAKRGREAMELGEFIERLGERSDKQNFSIILAQGAIPLLQQPGQDLPLAADMARKSLRYSDAGTQLNQLANYALGIATFFQATAMHEETVKGKSCEGARRMKALIDEAGPALEAGRPINPEAVERYLEKGIKPYLPTLANMQKQFCR